MDTMFSWVLQEAALGEQDAGWKWMLAYTYLLGSINYLGAEQALCSVFFSMICFSYWETFAYANYSYSGEAAFRMYSQWPSFVPAQFRATLQGFLCLHKQWSELLKFYCLYTTSVYIRLYNSRKKYRWGFPEFSRRRYNIALFVDAHSDTHEKSPPRSVS